MRHRDRKYQRASVIDKRNQRDRALSVTMIALIADASNKEYDFWASPRRLEPRAARTEIERRYRIENQISHKEFATEHWQTMFLLEYPALR